MKGGGVLKQVGGKHCNTGWWGETLDRAIVWAMKGGWGAQTSGWQALQYRLVWGNTRLRNSVGDEGGVGCSNKWAASIAIQVGVGKH